MNTTTESTSTPNQPFTCDASRLIDRVDNDADKEAAEAQKWLDKVSAARTRVTARENEFLEDLAESTAEAVVAEKASLQNCLTIAGLIEEAGGVHGIREKIIFAPSTFDILATGFRERGAIIQKLLAPARRALAEARGRHTEAGLNVLLIERTEDVIQLHARVKQIESAIENASVLETYCRNRKASDRHQYSFATLRGSLVAPLPQLMTAQLSAA